jgi:hypothetical protein
MLVMFTAHSVEAASFSLVGGTFKQGCPVSAAINMNTVGKDADAANILVHYNPAEVQINDASAAQPGTQIAPGTTFSIYADNAVDPAAGIIRLTGFNVGYAYNGSGLFGSIPFQSMPGVTSSIMTVEFISGSTTDSNIAETITSDDILTSVTNATMNFVTGPCTADLQPPRVVSTNPTNGATNIALTAPVSFRITDNQAGVDLNSLKVNIHGTVYTLAGADKFTYTGVPLDYTITIQPAVAFPANTEIVAKVDAKDLDNNVMSTYVWTFNKPPPPPPPPPVVVIDTEPPKVSFATPPDGYTGVPLTSPIIFRITDNMSGVDLTALVVNINGTDYKSTGATTFSSSGVALDYTITVAHATPFPANTLIVVKVDAKDKAANVMPTYTWSFNQPVVAPPPTPPGPPSTPPPQVICPAPSVCGNGICDATETPDTCRFDCAPSQTGTTAPIGSVIFKTLDGSLVIPQRGETVHVLPNESYEVYWTNPAAEQPTSVTLMAATGQYALLSKNNGSTYETKVSAPMRTGPYTENLRMQWADGRISTYRYILSVDTPFVILDENGKAMPGVAAVLYRLSGRGNETVNSTELHKNNPQISDESGLVRFVVKPGTYVVETVADGYAHGQSDPFQVEDTPITGTLVMHKAVNDIINETISSSQPLDIKLNIITKAAQNAIAESLISPVRRAQKNPEVQAGAEYSLASLVLGTVTVLGVGSSAYSVLPAIVLFLMMYWYERKMRRCYLPKKKTKMLEDIRRQMAAVLEFLMVPLFAVTAAVAIIRPSPLAIGLAIVQVIGFTVLLVLHRSGFFFWVKD